MHEWALVCPFQLSGQVPFMFYAETHNVYVPLWIISEHHLGGNPESTESDTKISHFESTR